MSTAAEALKKAIEHDKKALEYYQEAIANAKHQETKDTLGKITAERTATIDSLSWVAMAESGELESESTPAESAEGTEEKPASKCPFSGALAEMGIDISKMSSMEDMDPEKMAEVTKMMEMKSSEEKAE
jgi:hypothetical protein